MYPLAIGDTFVIQHTVTGTGTFDGTDRGRARRTITFTGGGVVRFAARKYGTSSNGYTLRFVDPGGIYTTTKVEQITSEIRVTLRRNANTILTTPQELADAINAVQDPSFPVTAFCQTDTGFAEAVAATFLTGGADPTRIVQNYFTWEYANLNAGYFGFENIDPIVVRSLSFRAISLPGNTMLNWYKVPMVADFAVRRPPAFVVDEATPIYTIEMTVAEPFLNITDIREPLLPCEALLLVTATAGVAKVSLRREGRFPYL